MGGIARSGLLPKGDHKQQRRKEKWITNPKQPKMEGPKYHRGYQPPSTTRKQLPQRVVKPTGGQNNEQYVPYITRPGLLLLFSAISDVLIVLIVYKD